MGVKCLAQGHNTMTRPGLEPGPLDPESSALTTRPPRLPRKEFFFQSDELERKKEADALKLKWPLETGDEKSEPSPPQFSRGLFSLARFLL